MVAAGPYSWDMHEHRAVATPGAATWSRVAGWVGIAAHVLVGGYLTLLSGLVAPMAGVVGIGVVMAGLLALWLATVGRHRWALLLLPVGALAAWWIILAVGEAAFGWTA